MKKSLFENKYLIESSISLLKNSFTYSIKNKSDSSSKMKNLYSNITNNEEIYKTQIYPALKNAKDKYDQILTLSETEINSSELNNSEVDSPLKLENCPKQNDKLRTQSIKTDDKSKLKMKDKQSKKNTDETSTPTKCTEKSELKLMSKDENTYNKIINEEVNLKSNICEGFNNSINKSFTNQTTHVISPSKRKLIKRRRDCDRTRNNISETKIIQSLTHNPAQKLLSNKYANYSAIKSKRGSLDNSLVYSALLEAQESNKIKSQFKEPVNQPLAIGKIFHSYDIKRILSLMYSSLKCIQEETEDFDIKEYGN